MPSAADVVASLSEDLVRLLTVGVPRPVSRVCISHEPGELPAGALIAAVGVVSADDQRSVVRAAAERSAAGVVIGRPAAGVSAYAEELGVTLASLVDEASWAGLVAGATALLEGSPAGVATAVDLHERLFELADDVAQVLGAHLTIEDSRNRVVAYSVGGGPHDEARAQSILGRAVPPEFVSRLRAMGAFRRLSSSDEPFIVPAAAPDFLQRLVIPLRLGPETVGSIWAIRDEGLSPELRRRLDEQTRTIALYLLRLRAQEGLASRYSVEHVRAALSGTSGATGVAALAEPPIVLPARTTRVVALGRGEGTSADDDVTVWRTVLRRRSWADPILADIDGTVFSIVGEGTGPGSWEWLRALGGQFFVVGASRSTASTSELPARRAESLEVLRTATTLGLAAASYEEVWDSLVIRRSMLGVGSDAHDELRALLAHESTRDVGRTLQAWLTSWGDYAAAAELLRVHPNTVRQRMRRIRLALPSVDLTDPGHRLALTLAVTADLGRPVSG